jgi:hypothetical protein
MPKGFTLRKSTSMLEFRKVFSKDLIYNRYIAQEQQEEHQKSRRTSTNLEHELTTLPKKRNYLLLTLYEQIWIISNLNAMDVQRESEPTADAFLGPLSARSAMLSILQSKILSFQCL